MVQMKGLTRVQDWKVEARKRRRTFLSSRTVTSKVKYLFSCWGGVSLHVRIDEDDRRRHGEYRRLSYSSF